MAGNKENWHLAGSVLGFAAWLNRAFGWFNQTVTAWLSFGSAACAVIALG